MFINHTQNTSPLAFQMESVIINGRKFVSHSKYKGPILKLTPEEQNKINDIKKNIIELELQLLKLNEKYSYNETAINKRDFKDNAFIKIEMQIKSLQDQIFDIKRERHQKQLQTIA